MKKVLIGGCFNTIHPGHIEFFEEAKKYGGYLIVVIANDINNQKPYAISAKERRDNLERLDIINEVVVGDKKMYETLQIIKPDVVVLGYDQNLPKTLKNNIPVIKLQKNGEYSSKSILDS